MEESDTLPDDEVRDAEQIARRTLALFGSISLAFRAPRTDILKWLKSEGLWDELSPSELEFVSAKRPTKKQIINASWKSEGLVVLLWALQKIDRLPAPNDQCDATQFKLHLPPFADISVSKFIAEAARRSDDALTDMADQILQLHWRARDACLHNKPIPPELDIEIIQERHHAINWVIGYDGLPWDEVTTDT